MSAMIGTVFRIDSSLREGVVWRTLNRLAVAGRPEPLERHHERAGALYDIDDPGAREVAFARLAQMEFVALDLLAPLEEALAERPALATRFGAVLVGEALGRAQEGVTCDGERNLLGFRVLPSRFDDGAALHGWCRHALGHAEDTLDPTFDFVPGWDAVPGAGGVAGRLHALWDVSVDGRAHSAGNPVPGADPRRHEAAIAAMLPPAHAPAATAVVERLWSGPRPTFRRLFDWAEHVERQACRCRPAAARSAPSRARICACRAGNPRRGSPPSTRTGDRRRDCAGAAPIATSSPSPPEAGHELRR